MSLIMSLCLVLLFLLVSMMMCKNLQSYDGETLKMCKCMAEKNPVKYTVDCSNAGLKSVPKGIPTKTTHLYLDNNYINILTNDSFKTISGLMLNLEVLSIQHNGMRIIEESAYKGLDGLQELNLYNNSLQHKDSLPKSVFLPLSRTLKVLDIRLNLVEQLEQVIYPFPVAELHNLEELKMDGLRNKPLPSEYRQLGNLEKLIFTNGRKNLISLPNDTFESVASLQIKEIHLAGLNLRIIDKGTFSKLLSLRKLDLSNNPKLNCGISKIASSLHNTSITALYLNNTGLGFSAWGHCSLRTILEKLCGLRLKELTLDRNYIHSDQMKPVFKACFPNLELLSFADNYIFLTAPALIADVMHLQNLTGFNISYQVCHGKITSGKAADRVKRQVHICQTGMACPFVLPPHLKWIDVSFNALEVANLPELVYLTNSTLESVKASYSGLQTMTLPTYCPWNIVPHIKIVDLRNNGLQCVNSTFFEQSLTGCNWNSLEYFYLGNNNLGQVENNVCNQDKTNVFGFLEPLAKLKVLDLSDNKIAEDEKLKPIQTLSELQVLDLSSNGFYNFSLKLDRLTKIDQLSLAFNNLNRLSNSFMIQLNNLQKGKSDPIELDLFGNPLSCDCASFNFLQWMRSTDIFLVSKETYQCEFNDGKKQNLKQLPVILAKLDSECFGSQWLQLYIGIGICIYFVIILFSLAYRMRHDIWFIYMKLKLNRKKLKALLSKKEYKYSAFVSCAHRDAAKFVIKNLLPNLETEETGLKFCVAQRNFLVGATIVDNIIRAMKSSRKVIFIISKHFISSNWCKEELKIAHQICLERGDNIIICIFMPNVKPDQLPATLTMIVKTVTYIEWPLDPRAQRVFWLKLQEGLVEGDPTLNPSDII